MVKMLCCASTALRGHSVVRLLLRVQRWLGHCSETSPDYSIWPCYWWEAIRWRIHAARPYLNSTRAFWVCEISLHLSSPCIRYDPIKVRICFFFFFFFSKCSPTSISDKKFGSVSIRARVRSFSTNIDLTIQVKLSFLILSTIIEFFFFSFLSPPYLSLMI